MDIDSSETATGPGADAQELVDELGTLIERIEGNPNNVRLLRRQIHLMVQLGMIDEAADGVNALSDLAFVGEGLWIKFLDAKINEFREPINLDAFADMLELFGKAQSEYLSAAIFKCHIQFLLCLAGSPAEDSVYSLLTGDAEVIEYLDPETVRPMLEVIVGSALALLNQSQDIWQLWMDWELRQFEASKSKEAKRLQLERIHELYLERLQVPQTTLDTTSSQYSTFLSKHCPDEYEARMVQVTEHSQLAKKKWAEKRHHKTRADFEEQLAYTLDTGSQLAVLGAYLDWETDPMIKNPKFKTALKQDSTLIRAVFERTLLAYGNVAGTAEEASFIEEATAGVGQSQMVETANAYKTAEAAIWARYLDFVAKDKPKGEESADLPDLSKRASRACPASGDLWSRQLTVLEKNNEIPAIETAVEKASNLIVGNQSSVTPLVDILVTHAAILVRRYRSIEPSLEHPVFVNLTTALETVRRHYDAGDPSLRLEKLFISWAEVTAPELLPGVLAVLDQPIKSKWSLYQRVNLVANAQARTGDLEAARETYQKAISRSDLDWPEAVYEAYQLFENVHGTLETVIAARTRIGKEQAKVNRRRQQEAEKQQAAAAEQYRLAAEAQAAAATVTAPATAATVEPVPQAMDVDAGTGTAPAETGTAAETVTHPSGVPSVPATRAADEEADDETALKRDRENTTVLVTGLKQGTTAERLTSFFTNWGKVRECTILPGDDGDTEAALVEFRFADAVPALVEKDQRKMDGHVIHVAMLWRSTLYVTNFPETADDATLRKLFSQYGKVLQTRWPSRKYAAKRRFCYITMESPAAAQEALVLHNFKIDGGEYPMSVLISDPAAKKKRAGGDPLATLFVGGLNSKTSEEDVRQLFAQYGTIVGIKLVWDPVKSICKGVAFVEMSSQAEAKAAIDGRNDTKYRGRALKVSISDRNHGAKKRDVPSNKEEGRPTDEVRENAERRARQVRIYDLPPGTQEGLLQQELEKVVPVKRVEVFGTTHEALIELASAADAGELLLRPFVFNGITLKIGEQVRKPPTASAAAPASSLAFAPRTRKAPKKVGAAYVPPKKAVQTAAPAAVPSGSGQDAFREFMTATNENRKDKLEEKKVKIAEKQARIEESRSARAGGASKDAPGASSAESAPVSAETAGTAGQKHGLEDAESDSKSKRAKTDAA